MYMVTHGDHGTSVSDKIVPKTNKPKMAYNRDPFLETSERDQRERLERERDTQDTRDGSMAEPR